jgi:polyferredoxin
LVQGAALGLTLFGVFYLGANCERWCPFGGVEAAYTYVAEGDMLCSLGVSNFFILGGVLASALLVRRAFCGYLCPIGTISAWLHGVAGRLRIRQFRVPPALDRWLSLLKYVLLAVILIITWRAGELLFRGFDPCYALISRHGADITVWAYVVAGAVVLGSLAVSLPFCRWLCPLAAVLNPFSRYSLSRVRRHSDTCSGCGVCARRCPMEIPVDRLPEVNRADCVACLACVQACPGNRTDKTSLSWGMPRPVRQRWSQAVLILLLLTCVTGAVAASYVFPVASFIRRRGIEPAEVATVDIQVHDLTCRGRANLFYYFLTRDDISAVPGYLKVEAWPGPGLADVRISYDPACTDQAAIQRAITEPYYDALADYWRDSPFQIEGYDPLDLLLEGI